MKLIKRIQEGEDYKTAIVGWKYVRIHGRRHFGIALSLFGHMIFKKWIT